jgi:hypothetical protein
MRLKATIVAAIWGSTLLSLPAFGQEKTCRVSRSIQSMIAWPSCDGTLDIPSHGLDSRSNGSDKVLAGVFWFPSLGLSSYDPEGAAARLFDPTTATGYRYRRGADFDIKHRSLPPAKHRVAFYNSASFNPAGLNGLDRFGNPAESMVVFGFHF